MARLPQPGSDSGTWGAILNDFLGQTLLGDGTLKPGVVTKTQISPGAVEAPALGAGTGSDGQFLMKSSGAATGIAWGTPATSGATNLSTTTSASSVTVASSTGSSAVISGATASAAGALTSSDKTKLDGVASGATANSTDAQLRDRSSHTGSQAIATVTNLQTTLDGKASATNGGLEGVSQVTASGATTLNLANGNVFDVTLTGNATFTFSGATAGKACSFTAYIKQDATGGRQVTWPGSVKWSGGVPALTTTGNAIDIVVFESINGGSVWFGSLVGTNFI